MTSEYKPTGRESRVRTTKYGLEVKVYDIPSLMEDSEALSAVHFFFRYKRMGMPYGAWGNNPNILAEVVDLLSPIDEFYRPRL